MCKGKIFFTVVVIVILLSDGVIKAQTNNHAITSGQAWEILDKKFGFDQRLVSGRSFPGEAKGAIIGHPFWIDSMWKEGSVTINGTLFSNLLLRFDISEGDLILNTSNLSNQALQVCLNMDDISQFFLGERKFVKFPGVDNSKNNRFCEVCAEGRLTYLVTRSKSMTIDSGNSAYFKYKENIGNYLLFEGGVIKFKNRQTLYKLFPAQKQELKKFIYQNALTITRKNTDNRARLVEYCNYLIDNS